MNMWSKCSFCVTKTKSSMCAYIYIDLIPPPETAEYGKNALELHLKCFEI